MDFGIALRVLILVTLTKATPLDDYVAKPDDVYSWETVAVYPDTGLGYSSYLINMTSQTWQTAEETNQPIWWHYIIVVVPTNLRFTDSAFLMVDNGDMDDSIPTPDTDGRFNSTIEYALGTGSIAADLKMVPNQELHCQGDPPDRWRREDDLIAWTWRRFLDDPSDPEILLQLPMAKSAVRALDTISSFARTILPENNISSFLVAGGSKRGWTTYLAAAVDKRIFAIVPEVLTCLNFVEVMRHQYRAYGGWSFSNQDYYDEDITSEIENPNMQLMMDIIDPYVYRDRLTMPKLVVSGAGDEHFMPDDTWYFWDDLVGQKFYWTLENSGHSIGSSPNGYKIRPNIIAFYLAVKTNFMLPQISWQREETSTGGAITVTTDTTPLEITAIYADTNDDLRRDFRKNIGIPDPSSPVPSNIFWEETNNIEVLGAGSYRIQVDYAPNARWRCFFIKMTYAGPDGRLIYVTTETNIVPDVFPYEDCHGEEQCRGVLL